LERSAIKDWPAADFALMLRRVREDGVVHAPGRRITADTLERILAAAPRDGGGRALLRDVDFSCATFSEDATFAGATFVGVADFSGATFAKVVAFTGSSFEDGVTFSDARFAGGDLGAIHARRGLSFERAAFSRPVSAVLAARHVSFSGVVFAESARIAVAHGEVELADARFGRPSVILASAAENGPEPSSRPRIVSLRGADTDNLLLSGLDLSQCRFAGASNLDRLRMEGSATFAEPPCGWHREGWRWWRWSRRAVLAEECLWRALRPRRSAGWATIVLGTEPATACPEPEGIELAYRALRRGREDAKDAPGAADFYFGEMEMRRHRLASAPRSRRSGERLLLVMYWLLSGYGLRAGRALLAFAMTVSVAAVGFYAVGISGGPGRQHVAFSRAVLYSLESSTSVSRIAGAQTLALSGWGELLAMLLHVIGPLLLGLALLSARQWVKR
jgi:hypothetical protein